MKFQRASAERFFDRARSRNPALFEKLMARTHRAEPIACWPYECVSAGNPYGKVKHAGRVLRPNRAMYALAFGAIPPGLSIMHTCDRPACVNPAHLRAATHAENMADRALKRRGGDLRGMNNGRAVLTDPQVRAIRASAEPTAALVRRFGVSKVTICGIRRGTKWRHVK